MVIIRRSCILQFWISKKMEKPTCSKQMLFDGEDGHDTVNMSKFSNRESTETPVVWRRMVKPGQLAFPLPDDSFLSSLVSKLNDACHGSHKRINMAVNAYRCLFTEESWSNVADRSSVEY
ncbi:uncharacterized protein LOC120181071 [Hibiscus syriacus]|uniref:uncharacterized protein LOC120181071 n=1 Tax=Hibiscus syriacus TaxID=106335 RepID=UPI0019248BE3|nr:uncharacterized protein LOC120181071 [Hibiscus syriacus]